MCTKEGEDVNYLILHCDFTMMLWWDMFKRFNYLLVNAKNGEKIDVLLVEQEKT